MTRFFSTLSTVLVGAMFASFGCGSGSDSNIETPDASALTFGSRSHRTHVDPGTGGSAAVTTTTSGAGGSGSAEEVDGGTGVATGTGTASTGTPAATSPSSTDVQAVISAAQNPDGTAIPQGPGPNGACPQVLVLLGFWSCPQIGQTCTYAAAGVSHDCACDKLNGEGGLPAWVCDQ